MPTLDELKINEIYIQDLSPEQISFSGKLLNDVFMKNMSNIALKNESEKETAYRLYMSFTTQAIRMLLLNALTIEEKITIVSRLERIDLNELFEFSEDFSLLKLLFKEFDSQTQLSILKHIYKKDSIKYTILRELSTEKVSMVGGVLVKKKDVVSTVIDQDKEALLNYFQSSKKSFSAYKAVIKNLSNKYELDDLEILMKKIIEEFVRINYPMNNQNEFKVHLKFYYVVEHFVENFPKLEQILVPLVDPFLMALKKMPSSKWTIKILNQFPVLTLRRLIKVLSRYESIPQFEKRNLYCKILNDINSNLKNEENVNIRIAVSLID